MRIQPPSREILSLGIAACFLSSLMAGCAPNARTFTYQHPLSLQCAEQVSPRFVTSEDNLTVWSYRGNLYVFGSKEAGRAFEKNPQAATGVLVTAAGPSGEDVFFESNPTHPEFSQELQKSYQRAPKLLHRAGREYSVWKHDNRIFILGPNPVVEDVFVQTGELTLSKTFFDAGPHGETVVVEANKSKNQFADLLMERYNSQPVLIEKRCPDFFLWKVNGRLIVLGSAESSLKLESGLWLPTTKAFIGIGPQGETVSFETDNNRPELFRRLATAFFGEGKVPQGVLNN